MRVSSLWRRKWSPKDVAIIILNILVIFLGGFVLMNRVHWGEGLFEAPSDAKLVAVFDVVIDRESGKYIDLLFDHPVGEKIVGEVLNWPPVTLSPSAGGFWTWRDKHVLRFHASRRLPMATEFHLSLIPVRFETGGWYLSGEREFQVRTDQFLVEQVDVNEEPALEGKGQVVFRGNIRFNYPVDPKELITKIRLLDPLRGESDPIEVKLETRWRSKTLGFQTAAVLKDKKERILRLIIAAELTPWKGNVELAQDFIRETPLGSKEKLIVRGVTVAPGEKESTLRLQFSSPVRAAIASSYLKVDPEVKFRVNSDRNLLIVTGSFRPGESYRLQIVKGMPGIDEAVLQEDWTSEIQIPHLSPAVNFQDQGMFLSRRGYRNVAVETVNADRVHLAIDRIYLNNLFLLFQYSGNLT